MKNSPTCCTKEESIVKNVSIPIDPKITSRLPFKSPKIPQKYAPNTIPKKMLITKI